MGHLSDDASRLKYKYIGDNLQISPSGEGVWFISLPYIHQAQNTNLDKINKELDVFIDNVDENGTIVILASSFYAASFLSELTSSAYLKLWFGVKVDELPQQFDELKQSHAALLVLTKYQGNLKHTKTRISYSFCPYCEKTTKDYGGKKHLYHEFGTLMSDVWRDIQFKYDEDLKPIITRLSDLFGLEDYSILNHIDLRGNALFCEQNISNHKYSKVINDLPYDKSILLNGDCLEELKNIPDNSIDFCFADPPYNIKKKYETWNDDIDIKEYFDWCDKWLNELARIVKPNKTVALLNIPQWSVRYFQYLSTLLDFQDWIIWEALGLPVRQVMPAHYTILCFSKGKPRELPGLRQTEQKTSDIQINALNTIKQDYCYRVSCTKKRIKENIDDKELISNIWWDIHRLKHNSQRVDHPTQLPPMLMYRLISLFTDENEVVLDPFNATGTTSLCAEQLKRKFIGIELSEYYHGIATNRHNELRSGKDPFRKNNDTPKSKNSYVRRVEKQKYAVDKKTLQLEVKRLAKRLGRIPSREDVIEFTEYKIEYFDNYFVSWSEVTAAARTTGMEKVENRKDYELLQK